MKKEEKVDKSKSFIVMAVAGGHGKNILATAVIEAVKKKYPNHEIVIVTAWDSCWYNNPNIYRVYNFGQMPYFFDDYVKEDTIIMQHDPYHDENHILHRTHLIETWCNLYNIPYNGEQPKLYINPREYEIARDKIKPHLGKPIMIIQTHGGLPSQQYSKKSWMRDFPIEQAQKIVNFYSKNYRILHIRLNEQPVLENTEQLMLPHREIYAVMEFSKKRLFIDSFGQHAAMAMGLKSTVCWIGNKPEIFGYDFHDNIKPTAKLVNQMNKYSYLEQYDISGSQNVQFPYNTVNVFDINQIIESINKQ